MRKLTIGIIAIGLLLFYFILSQPKRCYCAGQEIDCAILKDASDALRVNVSHNMACVTVIDTTHQAPLFTESHITTN
jgi:hypothetical protein